MRIVAGLARGRRLAPPAAGTRPTSDRAREALFNSLSTLVDLPGARMLDLYAGTGAAGLEALSRGAVAAVFVESDRAAVHVLRRNVDSVGLPGATVHRQPVAAFLAGGPEGDAYDIVFADPPYALADDAVADNLAALLDRGWLSADAMVVIERSVRSPPPDWPERITAVQDRRYGEGVLWYGRRR